MLFLEEVIMHREEVILIPKRVCITKQPQKNEFIGNPLLKTKLFN